MNDTNRQELEVKITKEIQETKKQIASLEELIKPVSPDNALGRLTRLDAIGSKSINEASLNKAKDRFNKLKYALANLDNPDFGICQNCEKPIPIARIMIMPESNLCVNCAD